MKIVLLMPAAVLVCWVLGDWIYSRVIAHRLRKWEATIQRDEQGVREGCREYSVGMGSTALLLVHGINDSPRAYHKMAPMLAEQGFACRVMRLPGFAQPMPRYAASTRQEWVAAVGREVAALHGSHDRVCVIAHSLGAAATIAHVCQYPESVDKVVLLAPAIAVSNRRSPGLSTRVWHEIGRRTLLFTQITETPFPNDAHDPAEQDYPWRTPFAPRSVFNETFALLDENRARAGQFHAPLLLVLSRDDRVVDWHAAERFYGQVASGKKQLHFAPDTGHAMTVDYGWEELTQRIADFCGEE